MKYECDIVISAVHEHISFEQSISNEDSGIDQDDQLCLGFHAFIFTAGCPNVHCTFYRFIDKIIMSDEMVSVIKLIVTMYTLACP